MLAIVLKKLIRDLGHTEFFNDINAVYVLFEPVLVLHDHGYGSRWGHLLDGIGRVGNHARELDFVDLLPESYCIEGCLIIVENP